MSAWMADPCVRQPIPTFCFLFAESLVVHEDLKYYLCLQLKEISKRWKLKVHGRIAQPLLKWGGDGGFNYLLTVVPREVSHPTVHPSPNFFRPFFLSPSLLYLLYHSLSFCFIYIFCFYRHLK